jgi:hypothetical protein
MIFAVVLVAMVAVAQCNVIAPTAPVAHQLPGGETQLTYTDSTGQSQCLLCHPVEAGGCNCADVEALTCDLDRMMQSLKRIYTIADPHYSSTMQHQDITTITNHITTNLLPQTTTTSTTTGGTTTVSGATTTSGATTASSGTTTITTTPVITAKMEQIFNTPITTSTTKFYTAEEYKAMILRDILKLGTATKIGTSTSTATHSTTTHTGIASGSTETITHIA